MSLKKSVLYILDFNNLLNAGIFAYPFILSKLFLKTGRAFYFNHRRSAGQTIVLR